SSGGSVDQSNTAVSAALAGNINLTGQKIDQDQGGESKHGSYDGGYGDSRKPDGYGQNGYGQESKDVYGQDGYGKDGYGKDGYGSGDSTQTAGQLATNVQLAGAKSDATQIKPSNDNVDTDVLSKGHDGSVSQSNT